MRSKLLFLMLIVLLAFAGPASAELVKDFEAGTTWEANGWAAWGSGSGSGPSGYMWTGHWAYIDDTGTGSDGGNYMNMTTSNQIGFCESWGWGYNVLWPASLDDEPVITQGQSYTIGGYFKDILGNGANGSIGFEWKDINGAKGNDDPPGLVPREIITFPITTDWVYYEETRVAPPLTFSLRPTWGNADPGTEVGLDQLWMDFYSKLGLAYDPTPASGAQGVDPATTQLSWKRTSECPDPMDPNLPIKPMVELWWGSQGDPNFWVDAVKIMDLADVDTFNLGDAIGGPISLGPDEYYYWGVKYEDPNECNWDAGVLEGAVWTFDTINRPPVVDAGLHYDRWQDDPCTPTPVKIAIDASYTDDGLPAGGNVTYTWSETLANGATTPSYPDGRNVLDPNVIFSSTGDYTLKLTIHDNESGPQDQVGEDEVLIRVFGNSDDRLRVHYELNGNVLDSDNSDPCDTHNGTIHDDPVYGTGQVGLAIELDGTDDVGTDGFGDFVSIDDTGSDPNWQPDTWENSDLIDGMTVYAWMKLDEDGWSKSWESIVAKSTDSWELLRSGSGSDVGFGIKGNVGSANSAGTDVTGGWHQVAGVYDRNKVVFYVDGLETASNDAGTLDLEAESNFNYLGLPINDQDWQIPKSAGKIFIGNTNNPSVNTTADLTFGGRIDQVRIFDAAVPYRAEHSGTPGIVEMYRADGGHDNCGGVYIVGDTNEDCYVTLADFALVCADWLDCNDVAEEDCPLSHHTQ